MGMPKRTGLLCVIVSMLCPVALAQTAVPAKLVGAYRGNPDPKGYVSVNPVELANVSVDGEKARGILNTRSPAGNCISENSPVAGTFKDGILNVRSERPKSQFADEHDCARVSIRVKLDAGHWTGTLSYGNSPYSVDFEAK